MKYAIWRRAGAELVGTYALVTAGCGAIMVDATAGGLTHVGVALTFGLIITVMVATVGHISGAHFNPAVTLAFALTRHFPIRDVLAYVGAQLLGAVAGALTLQTLFGSVANLGATLPAGSAFQALGLEILLSAVLMFVIIAVATDTRGGSVSGPGNRRNGNARCLVGRTDQRRIDESGTLLRSRVGRWPLARSVGVLDRAH